LGSLRTLTILLALGAWGAATEGAPPSDGTSQTSGSTRATLPAPPVEYLNGGIRLFNTGDPANAAKYLKVASDYRDQLQPGEQATLDDYLAKLNPAPTDPAVKTASGAAAAGTTGTVLASPSAAQPPGTQRTTSDPKQEARWKLQAAREQIARGNFDEATRIVVEVQKMNIKWGLFDETPTKVAETIAKARSKAGPVATQVAHDKKQALAKLKEARDLLANSQYDQAEALAIEVNTWGVSYSMWDDKPSKVAAAARALRNRDKARGVPAKYQPSTGDYQELLTQSRQLIAAGKFDQAEVKARQALGMNVYPAPTADRAEAVLHDLALAKASASATAIASATPAGQPAQAMPPAAKSPVVETPSLIAEREANQLLIENKNEAAALKFAEADRLKAAEMAQPPAMVPAVVAVVPGRVVDQAVKQATAANPGLEPPAQNPAGGVAPPMLDPPAPAVAGQAQPVSLDSGPVPIADPTIPPSAMPSPNVSPLPSPLGAAPSLSSDAPPPGNKGEELLAQARALFSSGNYPAAREKVAEAKAGKYGVDAQADEIMSQIALSEQGGALAVYEAALEAIRGMPPTPSRPKGVDPDFDRARALLTEVLNSGATLDEGMMQKVQDLLTKLPKDGSGKATASDVPTSDAESLKAQQMNAEVGTKVAEARRLMETDPERAIALLQTTLTSVKAAELPQTVARTMTRRLEVAIELAKADKLKFDEKMKDKNAKAEIETKKLRILEADMVKRTAVNDLMKKAEEAQANGEWAKAEELARRAIEIDPNDLSATALAWKANVQRHYEVDKKNRQDKAEGFLNEMQGVDELMNIDPIASRTGISFPKDFKEMSVRRKKMQLSDSRQKTIQELAIEKKLNEPITLNLRDQTLDEAIAFISNYTGLNVIVDPKALNDEGLSRDSKVNLTANSIKLKNALKYMLKPLGLTYKAEDEVLLITSPQASRDKTYSWTYPVADLVVPPSKPQSMSVGGNPLEPGALGMSGSPQANAANGTWGVVEKSVTISDMMPLVQLITNTIAPNTWKISDPSAESSAYGMGGAFGGAADAQDAQPGSITPFLLSISLIIRHTAEVHEDVAELLKQLRRLQDLQVSVEVRFITVSDDFFEQIGVDFDFNIQSKTVGTGTSFAAPSGSNQAAGYPFDLVSSTSGGTAGTTGGISGGTTGGVAGGAGGVAGGRGGTAGTTGGGIGGGGIGGGGGAGGIGGGGGGFAGGGGGGGGISGGGFAGGGGGVGGAGNFGGGGTAAGGGGTGTAGGTAGGTGSTGVGYIVNPFLDNSLGARTPVIVGTSSGGIGNYTNNLGIPFTQQSAQNIAPFNAITGVGATLGISFLSDLEMYLFLTAAQGDTRNNIVQAPKITTFNGANATITNAEVQYYVQQLTPIVGPGSVAFLPTPAPLNDGVTLSVTPVVSADRRYVRLSLAPNFNTINGLQAFPVPAAVGGGGLGGTGTSVMGLIQLPQTTTTFLNTTVTVPDGGTVLLGGVKRMREQRLEYGVPVLSKTPYINRLFRNIGIGRRTDSLMLMVTPRIIILEEEEDRLGVRTINPNP
jgi:type II secretory pathway component GspD/PulD (secretin)